MYIFVVGEKFLFPSGRERTTARATDGSGAYDGTWRAVTGSASLAHLLQLCRSNSYSDTRGLGWGLKFCISNTLPGGSMLLVHRPDFEKEEASLSCSLRKKMEMIK